MTPSEKIESLQAIAPDVSRETAEKMIRLEAFFLKWAKTINLVSPATLNVAWHRHFLDSAQIWRWRGSTKSWIDLGSGSGFPALVIAVLETKSGSKVTLVESNVKKSAYLRQAIAALDLNAEVLTIRVEELDASLLSAPETTITARAFAPLDRMLDWTNGFGSPSSRALLHKGRGFQDELADARRLWAFDLLEHASLVDSDSVILDITAVRRL
ncbi:16S rRNA (guanine(527)-N(7))-methyltransferase RsmG [Tianweitania sp. BSSL-BM11]|uniref:Ribosomal RNA small subunit methyltransferase G n=1 Tax=Tianweitania aestuarii TaxID=2814886 RepID=A0ABS5S130_9HYPH|nr:16S rRNA (guanine(527)-N(7))-methyltransferase RsmG [Tianweitania aestuarii]MBS9721632.1 16S rRNA (guanine(527)-N(7))-methyltransferase RsmG [Tianweitania aestuarii]